MLPKILFTASILAITALSPAFAQSAIDIQTIKKADAIMAEIKTADATQLPDLVSQLGKLDQTTGLSEACKRTVISMQESAALTPSAEDLEDMPEEIQEMVKAKAVADQPKYNAERAACLNASAQPASATTTQQTKVENNFTAPTISTNSPAKDTRPYHLIKLRERIIDAFNDKDIKGVEALKSLVYVGTQVKEKNVQCNFTKIALMKETTAYIQLLKSTNAESFNRAAADVQTAALAFESALAECD